MVHEVTSYPLTWPFYVNRECRLHSSRVGIHDDHLISEAHCLVDIVRDEYDGLFGLCPDVEQFHPQAVARFLLTPEPMTEAGWAAAASGESAVNPIATACCPTSD